MHGQQHIKICFCLSNNLCIARNSCLYASARDNRRTARAWESAVPPIGGFRRRRWHTSIRRVSHPLFWKCFVYLLFTVRQISPDTVSKRIYLPPPGNVTKVTMLEVRQIVRHFWHIQSIWCSEGVWSKLLPCNVCVLFRIAFKERGKTSCLASCTCLFITSYPSAVLMLCCHVGISICVNNYLRNFPER